MDLPCCKRLLIKDDDLFVKAAENGNVDIIKCLYDKISKIHGKEKANHMINKANGEGTTPLMLLCKQNSLDGVNVSSLSLFSSFYKLKAPPNSLCLQIRVAT